jgi:hypothetical protein
MIRTFAAASAIAAILAAGPALAAATTLTAALSGANETAGGDPDGTGSFTVEIDADSGDFCYTIKAAKIAAPTMVHVHSGAAGADGPPVVTLSMGEDLCIAAEPDVLRPIVANPAGFYVNVHTGDFPKGAVRGQLAKK